MEVIGVSEDDRLLDQIEKWANGHFLHNNIDDICCPDYSCCIPEIKTAPDKRQEFLRLFIEQGVEGIVPMLEEFIAAAILHSAGESELLNANISIDPQNPNE